MFSRVMAAFKDYFVREGQREFAFYPSEDGIVAYYTLAGDDPDSAKEEEKADSAH